MAVFLNGDHLMRMVLVRHGQSEANAIGMLQGWMDSPLTEKGRNQARRLGQVMKNAGDYFDYIYSSDLSRASETAKIIGEILDNPSIKLTHLLREMDLGIFTGKIRNELDSEEEFLLENAWQDYSKRIPNGESINEFISRLKKLLKLIESLNPQPRSLLIVTHGGSLYHILKSILKVFPVTTEWLENCRINEIVKTSTKWRMVTFNGKKV